MLKKSIAILLTCAATLGLSHQAHAGDAARGKDVFKKCMACHAIEAGKTIIGPSLAGIAGRPIASIAGFKYSEGLQGLQKNTWTDDNLKKWMTRASQMVPGTKETSPGVSSEVDRENLLAYLRTLK